MIASVIITAMITAVTPPTIAPALAVSPVAGVPSILFEVVKDTSLYVHTQLHSYAATNQVL